MAEIKVSSSLSSEAAHAATKEMLALPQSESLPNASSQVYRRVPPPSQWGNPGPPQDLGDLLPRPSSPLPPIHPYPGPGPGPVPMPMVPPLQPRYGIFDGVEIPLPVAPANEYRGPRRGQEPAPVEPMIDGRTTQIAAAGELRDLVTSSPPSSLDWLEPLSSPLPVDASDHRRADAGASGQVMAPTAEAGATLADGREPQRASPGAWDAVKPDVVVFGETHGGPLGGGNFALVSLADGSATYFGSKPLTGTIPNPFNLPGVGRVGVVGTMNSNGQEAGVGFAGKVPTPAGDLLIWGNVRAPSEQELHTAIQKTRDNPGSEYTVSINVGAGYSVSDGALLALAAATGGKGLGVKSRADAAGFDAWLGLGYRGTVTWKNGEIDHFNFSGVKVRPDELFPFLADQVRRPNMPVIPNGGDSRIASLNDTMQALFGQSPWDIGNAAILRRGDDVVTTARGGVDVRNHGNSIVAVTEPIYELATESGLLAPGARIRDNAHAASLIDALFEQTAGDPAARSALTARLLNPYHLTFGAPSLDMAQRMFDGNALMQATVNQERSKLGLSPLGGKPADYDFVRSVFQGDYRWHGDNPPRDTGLGQERRL